MHGTYNIKVVTKLLGGIKYGKFVNMMTDFVPPGSSALVVNLIIPKRP